MSKAPDLIWVHNTTGDVFTRSDLTHHDTTEYVRGALFDEAKELRVELVGLYNDLKRDRDALWDQVQSWQSRPEYDVCTLQDSLHEQRRRAEQAEAKLERVRNSHQTMLDSAPAILPPSPAAHKHHDDAIAAFHRALEGIQ